MNLYFLIIILGISILTLISYLLFKMATFNHLKKVTEWLVLSLPLERIPSFDSPLGTLRVSQVLVIIGFWIFLVLLYKSNKEVLKTRINHNNFYFLGLLALSIPSFLFVLDFNRFMVTFIGTLLVFGAFFLITNFLFEITKVIKQLVVVLFAVALFSWYQLVADLAGLPPILTGLRSGYTKEVFGIARIHGTALEPSYYSMMLIFPLFLGVVLFLYHSHKFKTNKVLFAHPIIVVFIFGLTILLTLSKAAYLVVTIVLLLLFVPIFKNQLFKRFQYFSKIIATSLIFGLSSVLFITPVRRVFNNFTTHLNDTLIGRAATIVERSRFLEYAFIFIREYVFTGIGSGQYGQYVVNLTGDLKKATWIVNNVYVEVWLEFGLFSFLVFMFFLVTVLYQSLRTLKKVWDKPINTDYVIFLSLLMTAIGCLIFWLFVSPIFMMPVFIYLALLVRANFFLDEQKKFR